MKSILYVFEGMEKNRFMGGPVNSVEGEAQGCLCVCLLCTFVNLRQIKLQLVFTASIGSAMTVMGEYYVSMEESCKTTRKAIRT